MIVSLLALLLLGCSAHIEVPTEVRCTGPGSIAIIVGQQQVIAPCGDGFYFSTVRAIRGFSVIAPDAAGLK